MKIVVALEDLKINVMHNVENKKEPFLKKDQFFLYALIPKILQSIAFKE